MNPVFAEFFTRNLHFKMLLEQLQCCISILSNKVHGWHSNSNSDYIAISTNSSYHVISTDSSYSEKPCYSQHKRAMESPRRETIHTMMGKYSYTTANQSHYPALLSFKDVLNPFQCLAAIHYLGGA